jgi:hypothetical protein
MASASTWMTGTKANETAPSTMRRSVSCPEVRNDTAQPMMRSINSGRRTSNHTRAMLSHHVRLLTYRVSACTAARTFAGCVARGSIRASTLNAGAAHFGNTRTSRRCSVKVTQIAFPEDVSAEASRFKQGRTVGRNASRARDPQVVSNCRKRGRPFLMR